MVMARREGVASADAPITALTVAGLAAQLARAVAATPFDQPWRGPFSLRDNLGVALTRRVMRSFMGYATSLRIEEFRSLELVLDDFCKAVLPPFVRRVGVTVEAGELGGVPGVWCRPEVSSGTVLYLHGGGYIGTSPNMYLILNAGLAHGASCDVFAPDYRLAPEFPFPAGVDDALLSYAAMLESGVDPDRLIVAGDSGGGGLAISMLERARAQGLAKPAGLLLLSPEVDLTLSEPSVLENASLDILPWNIPVEPYLHGTNPADGAVSGVDAELEHFPPTLVVYGGDEMFRDGIRRFVDRLVVGGVEVETHEEAGMFHVFPMLLPWTEASERTARETHDFIATRLAASVGRDGDDEPASGVRQA